MSEQPVDLMALDADGHPVFGEVNVDSLKTPPSSLMLTPRVSATREAITAINEADLVLIGPGSFYTSLMPIVLLDELAQALRRTAASLVFIDNLGRELSAAAALSLNDRLAIIEATIGKSVIDVVVRR